MSMSFVYRISWRRSAQKPAAAFFGSEFKSLSDILQHRAHWPTRSKLIFHLRRSAAGMDQANLFREAMRVFVRVQAVKRLSAATAA